MQPTDSGVFRFIHCSDWHLPMPVGTRLGGWHLKQLLGRVSWAVKRRHRYRREVFEAAMHAWTGLSADRICITGDLVNFAWAPEYPEAARLLERVEKLAPVSLVPGNHDALVADGLGEQRRHWNRWLAGEAGGREWPSVTLHGAVAFVGLSSSVPTLPFMAKGAVSPAQLAELEEILRDLGRDGHFRVVMIHHPPQPGAIAPRAALSNGQALRDVLQRAGAELVLHGHLHHPVRAALAGPSGPIPVLGAGSVSSCRAGGRADRGHFHLVTLKRQGAGAWRVDVTNYFYGMKEGRYSPGQSCEIPAAANTNQFTEAEPGPHFPVA